MSKVADRQVWLVLRKVRGKMVSPGAVNVRLEARSFWHFSNFFVNGSMPRSVRAGSWSARYVM